MRWTITTDKNPPDKLKKDNWVQYQNDSAERKIAHIRIFCDRFEYDASSRSMIIIYTISISTTDPKMIRLFRIKGFNESESTINLFISPKLNANSESRSKTQDTNDFANFLLELESYDESIHDIINSFYASFSENKPYSIDMNEFYHSLENGNPQNAITAALTRHTEENFPVLKMGKVLEEKYKNNAQVSADHIIEFYQKIQPSCEVYKECNKKLLQFLSGINLSNLTPENKVRYLEYQFQAAAFTCDPSGDQLFWKLCNINTNISLAICTQGSLEETSAILIKIANEMRKFNSQPKNSIPIFTEQPELQKSNTITDINDTLTHWKKVHTANCINYKNESTTGKIKIINIFMTSYSNTNTFTGKLKIETSDPELIRFFSLRCYEQQTLPHDESSFVFTTNELDAAASAYNRIANNEFTNFLFELQSFDETINEVISDFYTIYKDKKTFSIDMHFFNRLINKGRIDAAITYAHLQNGSYTFPYLQFGRILEEAYRENPSVTVYHLVRFYNGFEPKRPLYKEINEALLKFLLSIDTKELDENSKIYILAQKFRTALIVGDKVAPYFYRELCGNDMNSPLITIESDPIKRAQMYIELASRIRGLSAQVKSLNARPNSSVAALGLLAHKTSKEVETAQKISHKH